MVSKMQVSNDQQLFDSFRAIADLAIKQSKELELIRLAGIEKTTGLNDKPQSESYAFPMNDITRPELDAKLELIEARMDARIARIESSVEGFKDEAGKLRTELSHAKYWAIGTAIAVLAIFAGFLQWGLQAQRDENARFSGYLREDVQESRQVLEQAKSLLEEIRAAQAK